MCGITAIFAYHERAAPVNRDELEAITAYMLPRGPDDGGTWVSPDDRVGLGSRRLAIIDLSPDGTQPMHDTAGDLTIVFNGEIYNHRELRSQLQSRGVRFLSHSDTEVLLEMYRHHGERMVELIRGMFAFAIWDARKGELFLARDPYGIKPLYYADDGRTFRAASTVKALLAGGAVSRERDPAGAAGFFLFGSVPEPFTIFESIRAVEAGTTLRVDAKGRRDARSFYSIASVYAKAATQGPIGDLTTPAIFLGERVAESVAAHLVADVPVGIFLSAGIDSATIAALAAESGAAPLHAVTILFEAFRGGELDEAGDAARFARERGILHTTRVVTRDEFLADLPRIFAAMDQPTVDGVNTWFVSKAAAEIGLKVALSGVGGDELFGSYPSFQQVPKIVNFTRAAARIPLGRTALRGALIALGAAGLGSPKMLAIPDHGDSVGFAYLIKRGIFMPEELTAVLPRDLAAAGLERLGLDRRLQATLSPSPATAFGEIGTLEASLYMRNQLLRDSDWASMAHSVEVRTPLVDASLLRQLAPVLVRYGASCKQYFSASPNRPLPPWLADRPKTGFVTPVPTWLGLAADGTPTRARSWARRVFESYA